MACAGIRAAWYVRITLRCHGVAVVRAANTGTIHILREGGKTPAPHD